MQDVYTNKNLLVQDDEAQFGEWPHICAVLKLVELRKKQFCIYSIPRKGLVC